MSTVPAEGEIAFGSSKGARKLPAEVDGMRPAFVAPPDESALAALAGLRARIALIDPTGLVVWGNASWSRFRQRQSGDSVEAVALGLNYLTVCRRSRHPAASAVAEGVRAVIERSASFFELEYKTLGPQGRRTKISATPAPAGLDGAMVMQVDSFGTTGYPAPLAAPRSASLASAAAMAPEVLTAREREVLTLMAKGLENRAIADELGIRYVTVRGHVRSLMAKLGVRSRLGAVVRAAQLDLVRVPRENDAAARKSEGRQHE